MPAPDMQSMRAWQLARVMVAHQAGSYCAALAMLPCASGKTDVLLRPIQYATRMPLIAQANKLTGTLEEYAAALGGAMLPSSTRFLGLGDNQLTGSVPQARALGTHAAGRWPCPMSSRPAAHTL